MWGTERGWTHKRLPLHVQPTDVPQPDVYVIRVYHLRRYLRLVLRQSRYPADAAEMARGSALSQVVDVSAIKCHRGPAMPRACGR